MEIKEQKMSTKAFKENKMSQIKEKIDKAQVAIVTEYKGYTVEEITNLRRTYRISIWVWRSGCTSKSFIKIYQGYQER